MTAALRLFGPCGDFLTHTLDHAGKTIKPVQIQYGQARITLHQVGILEFIPEHPESEALVLSAGIHGNETAPIELLNLLINELLNESLLVARPTLFVLGHPEAMLQQCRFIEQNMNRLFGTEHPEPPAKTVDARRAAILKAELKRFHRQNPVKEHYDLHTAIRKSVYPRFAVCPFQNSRLTQDAQYSFLEACGIQAILLQDRPASTFSAFSAAVCSSPESTTFSYTVELGQAHAFGNNDLTPYKDTLKSLGCLLSCQPIPPNNSSKLRFYAVTHEIIHSGTGFKLKIPENTENFSGFSQGTEVCSDPRGRYQVQHTVEYIAFPNSQVEPGERAGLMLIEVKQAE